MSKKGITPKEEDYAQWYLDCIALADLAEHSLVKGSMVIKPYGYALWEKMQATLDKKIKETGHQNVYFPLLIPKSLLEKEAGHAKGFAKEMAIVTHTRLKETADGKGLEVDPESRLKDEVIIRPTSETIMYATFGNWIQSWRDLPLKLNQWANVVRWEMRTRLFLRTSEFLWQEGHTVHATAQEAKTETRDMLNMYQWFCEEFLAMPVVPGTKSLSETFPGAEHTESIEAMMSDKKALQAGTSHDLGQNFAKAFDITFADKDNKKQHAWQTSWGVSTRLIGALIMTHSDNNGLVLPPKIAPIQTVIIPIWKDDAQQAAVLAKAKELQGAITKEGMTCDIDDRDDQSPGFKFNKWEKKGVPIRIEIGPRDLEQNTVVCAQRDTGEKEPVPMETVPGYVQATLQEMQQRLLAKAKDFRKANSHTPATYEEMKESIKKKGGFMYAGWCGSEECEKRVNEETKATIRCIPFEQGSAKACIVCGKKAKHNVIFAKAY